MAELQRSDIRGKKAMKREVKKDEGIVGKEERKKRGEGLQRGVGRTLVEGERWWTGKREFEREGYYFVVGGEKNTTTD